MLPEEPLFDATSPQFGQAVLSQDNQPREIVFAFKLFI